MHIIIIVSINFITDFKLINIHATCINRFFSSHILKFATHYVLVTTNKPLALYIYFIKNYYTFHVRHDV
jgi:hypothetical protein